jgi:hypothetical protein
MYNPECRHYMRVVIYGYSIYGDHRVGHWNAPSDEQGDGVNSSLRTQAIAEPGVPAEVNV